MSLTQLARSQMVGVIDLGPYSWRCWIYEIDGLPRAAVASRYVTADHRPARLVIAERDHDVVIAEPILPGGKAFASIEEAGAAAVTLAEVLGWGRWTADHEATWAPYLALAEGDDDGDGDGDVYLETFCSALIGEDA
jgi:hypothetical protein